jgi:muconate cycloisomerase
MTIESITAIEVLVPARQGAVNSPTLDRPLHKLPVAGEAAWNKQFDELPKCLLLLACADGTVGLGELYRDHDWRVVESIARVLVGKPLESLYRQQLPIALCREYDGFECAIWDAVAKRHNLRLVDLLGGPVRDKVRIGAWSGHRTLDEIGPLCGEFQRQGFDCVKFKCDLEDDVVGWAERIADAAPGLQVILDPNERWERAHEARIRIDGLQEFGNILCLEDPLPRWMLHEYAALKNYSSVPIALHVSLPYIQHGQRVHNAVEALRLDAVDGFNFNGGLAKFAQMDHIAAAANLPCWHGSEIDLGILEAMYVHQSAAALSCEWPGDIFGRLIRQHDLLKQPLRIEPPFVHLPEGPGLGVELDEDAIAGYQQDRRVFQ